MAFNVNKFISHFDSHGGFARTSKFEARVFLPAPLYQATQLEALSLQCETAELPGYVVNTVEQKIFGAPTYMAASPSFGDITLSFICAGDLWEKKLFDAWMDFIIPKSSYLVNYKSSYQTNIEIEQFSDYVGTPKPEAPQPNLKQLAELGVASYAKNALTDLASRKLGSGLAGDLTKALINNQYDNITGKNKNAPPAASQTGTKIYGVKLINAFPTTVNAMQLNWASDDIHRLSVTFKYDKWVDMSSKDPINLPPVAKDGTVKNLDPNSVKGVVLSNLIGKIGSKINF
jgi:hypothetical protein